MMRDISKHMSGRSDRMCKNRSPAVAGAVCLPPRNSRKGCKPLGFGADNIRSHSAEPIPVTMINSASGERNETDRARPENSVNAERTAASPPSLTVSVMKKDDLGGLATTVCIEAGDENMRCGYLCYSG